MYQLPSNPGFYFPLPLQGNVKNMKVGVKALSKPLHTVNTQYTSVHLAT